MLVHSETATKFEIARQQAFLICHIRLRITGEYACYVSDGGVKSATYKYDLFDKNHIS